MSLERFHKFFTGGIKRVLVLCFSICLLSFVGGICLADPGGESPQTTEDFGSSLALVTLLDILLLVGILICFSISLRVKSFLRDGELASGWSLFSISFVLLFIAQLLSFAVNIKVTNISHSIISSVRLLSILSLASGIYFMKKVLS